MMAVDLRAIASGGILVTPQEGADTMELSLDVDVLTMEGI